MIREVCQKGVIKTVKPTRVDVYLESHQNDIYLIDIKTAKPNKGGFKEFKRTLLEWTATVFFEKVGLEMRDEIDTYFKQFQ